MTVPLLSGFGYAVAAIILKKGSIGAGAWRVTFIVNWVMAIVFCAGLFFPSEHPMTLANFGHAAVSGALFFCGQVFTFLALTRGDVSVATPVLGSKVIFVALFTVLFGLETLGGAIWMAVLLTAVATTLLGSGGGNASERAALFRSVFYGFSAACLFALMDVTQMRWIHEWSVIPYMSALFLTMAVLSLSLLPLFVRDGYQMTAMNWRWLSTGATLISIQACGVAWSVMHLGATTTNVLYNSRGVWSVMLVWVIGPWFGNMEGAGGNGIMLRRLAGSLVLLSAIFMLTRR